MSVLLRLYRKLIQAKQPENNTAPPILQNAAPQNDSELESIMPTAQDLSELKGGIPDMYQAVRNLPSRYWIWISIIERLGGHEYDEVDAHQHPGDSWQARDCWHYNYLDSIGIPSILASHISAFGPHFPSRFIDAVGPDTDLSVVWPAFAIWLLVDPCYGIIRHADTDEQKQYVTEVASMIADYYLQPFPRHKHAKFNIWQQVAIQADLLGRRNDERSANYSHGQIYRLNSFSYLDKGAQQIADYYRIPPSWFLSVDGWQQSAIKPDPTWQIPILAAGHAIRALSWEVTREMKTAQCVPPKDIWTAARCACIDARILLHFAASSKNNGDSSLSSKTATQVQGYERSVAYIEQSEMLLKLVRSANSEVGSNSTIHQMLGLPDKMKRLQ